MTTRNLNALVAKEGFDHEKKRFLDSYILELEQYRGFFGETITEHQCKER